MADIDNNAGENVFNAIDTDSTEWDLSHNPKLGVDLGRLMLRKDPDSGAEIRTHSPTWTRNLHFGWQTSNA